MRKGKRERELARKQWGLVKAAKQSIISANIEAIKAGKMPTSNGYRKVDVMMGHTFNNPSNMGRYDNFGADGTKFGVK